MYFPEILVIYFTYRTWTINTPPTPNDNPLKFKTLQKQLLQDFPLIILRCILWTLKITNMQIG